MWSELELKNRTVGRKVKGGEETIVIVPQGFMHGTTCHASAVVLVPPDDGMIWYGTTIIVGRGWCSMAEYEYDSHQITDYYYGRAHSNLALEPPKRNSDFENWKNPTMVVPSST